MPKAKRSRSSSKSGEDKAKKTKNSITKENQPDVATDAPAQTSTKKGAVRKSRTMVETAKEGKAYLKAQKSKKRTSTKTKSAAKKKSPAKSKSRSKSTKKGTKSARSSSKSPTKGTKKGGKSKSKAPAAEDTSKPAADHPKDDGHATPEKEEKKEKRGRSKSSGKAKSGGKKKSVKRLGTMQATVKAAKSITKGVKGKRRSASKKKK